VLQAGDSHTLGPQVATAQLRRLGASVRILFGPDSDAVVHALAAERYDLVLFSASRADSLASIAKMVKSIRSRVLVPPQMVLGGIVLNLAADVRDMTGVDLVTNDVKVALKLREKTRSGTRFLAR
jgi:methylmalonyl-CoA mutase cobalamin-binding subunit